MINQIHNLKNTLQLSHNKLNIQIFLSKYINYSTFGNQTKKLKESLQFLTGIS